MCTEMARMIATPSQTKTHVYDTRSREFRLFPDLLSATESVEADDINSVYAVWVTTPTGRPVRPFHIVHLLRRERAPKVKMTPLVVHNNPGKSVVLFGELGGSASAVECMEAANAHPCAKRIVLVVGPADAPPPSSRQLFFHCGETGALTQCSVPCDPRTGAVATSHLMDARDRITAPEEVSRVASVDRCHLTGQPGPILIDHRVPPGVGAREVDLVLAEITGKRSVTLMRRGARPVTKARGDSDFISTAAIQFLAGRGLSKRAIKLMRVVHTGYTAERKKERLSIRDVMLMQGLARFYVAIQWDKLRTQAGCVLWVHETRPGPDARDTLTAWNVIAANQAVERHQRRECGSVLVGDPRDPQCGFVFSSEAGRRRVRVRLEFASGEVVDKTMYPLDSWTTDELMNAALSGEDVNRDLACISHRSGRRTVGECCVEEEDANQFVVRVSADTRCRRRQAAKIGGTVEPDDTGAPLFVCSCSDPEFHQECCVHEGERHDHGCAEFKVMRMVLHGLRKRFFGKKDA